MACKITSFEEILGDGEVVFGQEAEGFFEEVVFLAQVGKVLAAPGKRIAGGRTGEGDEFGKVGIVGKGRSGSFFFEGACSGWFLVGGDRVGREGGFRGDFFDGGDGEGGGENPTGGGEKEAATDGGFGGDDV